VQQDPASRKQTVVEACVVWEAMHQNDRRFLSRVFSNVDPVLVPLYESLLVDNHSDRSNSQRSGGLAKPHIDQALPGRRHRKQ
jgi:hypothetical protein